MSTPVFRGSLVFGLLGMSCNTWDSGDPLSARHHRDRGACKDDTASHGEPGKDTLDDTSSPPADTAEPSHDTHSGGPSGGDDTSTPSGHDTGDPPSSGGTTCRIWTSGDISRLGETGDDQTATLIDDALADAPSCKAVLALGDLAYSSGTTEEFNDGYDRSWGSFKDITHPVPGNHEYGSSGAGPYFDYFGSAAGTRGEGWYSFDLGEWHVVALNSNCDEISGGCGAGGAQERWLRADLEASDKLCQIAYWHHARFSTGDEHGSDSATADLWSALEDNGVDVVLVGHDHDYERFEMQNGDGVADHVHGIREFVVGTGGGEKRGLDPSPLPTTEVRNADGYGVMTMDLRPTGYTWEFLPAPGNSFTDSGSTECHGPP